MPEYYDRNGEPISMAEWAVLFSDRDYQRIALTSVNNGIVSTVWLGLDHSFGHGPKRLIFETMVFGLYLGDQVPVRAESLDEAMINHEAAVMLLDVETTR